MAFFLPSLSLFRQSVEWPSSSSTSFAPPASTLDWNCKGGYGMVGSFFSSLPPFLNFALALQGSCLQSGNGLQFSYPTLANIGLVWKSHFARICLCV